MNKALKVGFVGAGFNTNFHIRSWIGVRHADIAGIADPNLERAQISADLCKTLKVGTPKIFSDVSEMAEKADLDVIFICSPNFTRLEVMKKIADAVKSGKCNIRGIACEKPLARTVSEAKEMLEMVNELGILHGYLENQVFSPSVVRGKEIIWARGAKAAGRPYLARCAEEHGGPHEPWFWSGKDQGGGVLNDMMCHSIEAARFLLADPTKPKDFLRPVTVNAEIATLKWARPEYAKLLKEMTGGYVDYAKMPSEDFARANVNFEDQDGNIAVAEVTTSWSFMGPGLRLSFELIGPEYYMQSNSLEPDLHLFFSRNIKGDQGEDLVEKQAAEQGLMPVVSSEGITYGYTDEDRYMIECFLENKMPEENWNDGLLVSQLLMTAYKSSELGKKIAFEPDAITDFVPKVASGTYKAKDALHTAD